MKAGSEGLGVRVNRLIVGAGLAVGLSAVGAVANAAVVVTDVELAGPSPRYTVDISVPGFSTVDAYDDALVLTIGGKQYLVNCDDLTHDIYLGHQHTVFNEGAISSNFNGGSYSAAQINQISWLLGQSIDAWRAGGPDEGVDLAAYQLASWEVGNPTASFTDANPTVAALAATFAAESVGKSDPDVRQLSSDYGVQAQLTAVPEPGIWTLMIGGLFAIGAALRGRRQSLRLSSS